MRRQKELKKHKLSLSQEEFLKRMNIVFGNFYDFSESVYINLLTKVKCICPKHGEFWSRPDHLMNGHGCPKCAIEKRANKERLTIEEVKSRIDKVFNKKYDTSKIKYKNLYEKITLICPIHGEFKSSPAHLFKGHGCPKCGNVGRKTTDSFKEELVKIFGDEYTYDKLNYKNNATKVIVTCKKHGDFEALPCHLVHGHGCPHCSNSSIMERKVSEILKSDGIEFVRQKNFDWMKRMKLDFFIPSKNIAIECQGIQHFKPIDYFGGEKAFKHQVKKDLLKKKLCEEHNIKVAYINYNEEINKRLKEIFL